MEQLTTLYLFAILAPLAGCLIAGLFRNQIGRFNAHRVTIAGVAISFCVSLYIATHVLFGGGQSYEAILYTWVSGGDLFPYTFNVGYLIDPLSSIMLIVVTFISLLVHIYSIGYMSDDDGYQRFFSYISLFTFMMLMLVTSNNFLQLFFGWEGVGFVSYLLIGFWFKREAAIAGSLKAFLVNRVGDFGFIIGIAGILAFTGSINYHNVFAQAADLSQLHMSLFPGTSFSVMTVICIFLFIGAMGKSAQVPLHVWLPESMEGPTPISALIHAATMVTAGIFMVARMSPLYEYSDTARSLVLIVGATGALFTGLLAIVMDDIKRVVAYSTLSQLGYMMAAMGASAYAAGMFHLITHACFKALLFLGAGSAIIALHHERDMRNMGNLRKYMPITYATFFIGSLAISAIPPFAGFFSKDMIISAIGAAHLPGASYAYFCVVVGAFVTALYSFRALFLAFHTEERMSDKLRAHLQESPWVVTLPLVLLAIPSVFLGALLIKPLLFAKPGLLGDAIFILPQHNVVAELSHEYHGVFSMIGHAFTSLTFWLSLAGIFTAWLSYIKMPTLPDLFVNKFNRIYSILMRKYGFDEFNEKYLVGGARKLGDLFFGVGDRQLIDGVMVNGSGFGMRWISLRARVVQSGYLYHYTSVMVIGLLLFLSWFLLG